MTEKSFTPVSIRRRSAAQECADAHTASADVRRSVRLSRHPLRARYGGFKGDFRADKMLSNAQMDTYLTSLNNPIKVGQGRTLVVPSERVNFPQYWTLTTMAHPLKSHSKLQ